MLIDLRKSKILFTFLVPTGTLFILIAIGMVTQSKHGFSCCIPTKVKDHIMPRLTPWSSVGGCGASSGSVSSDMQLKWIGKGISGAYFDVEAIAVQSMLSDEALNPDEKFDGHLRLKTSSLIVSLLMHPRIADFKLCLPLVFKQGNNAGTATMTGPLGDLAIETSRGWGMEGRLRTALAVGFPTGRYDVPLEKTNYLLPELQPGGGLFTGSMTVDYTVDRDWGLICFGGSVFAGLFAVETEKYRYDSTRNMAVASQKTLTIARDDLGSRNDIGTLQPDVASIFSDIGITAEGVMHGFTLSYSIPFRNGEYEERYQEVTGWSGKDTAALRYFADKSAAQVYADTVTITEGILMFENPRVLCMDSQGRWVVMNRPRVARPSYPSVSIQYSLEKNDMNVPFLFGTAIRLHYDKGFVFNSFAAGVGIKFRLF